MNRCRSREHPNVAAFSSAQDRLLAYFGRYQRLYHWVDASFRARMCLVAALFLKFLTQRILPTFWERWNPIFRPLARIQTDFNAATIRRIVRRAATGHADLLASLPLGTLLHLALFPDVWLGDGAVLRPTFWRQRSWQAGIVLHSTSLELWHLISRQSINQKQLILTWTLLALTPLSW